MNSSDIRSLITKYLKPQRRTVLGLGLLVLGGVGLQLLGPQILSGFIDQARTGEPLRALQISALLFLAVSATSHLVGALAVYASERVGWTATNSLRADLALHCLRLDLPFHQAKTPGEMIERVDGEVTHLSTFFSHFVIRIAGNAILLVGILGALFLEDWRAGAAYTVFTATALLTLKRLVQAAIPYWKQARQAGAALIGFIEERLGGTEDIRSSAATPYVMHRLAEAMREQLRRNRPAWLMATTTWASTVILLALGNALAFGLGAYLLRRGVVTLGTVYLFFHYSEMLRRPLEQITRQMQELQRAGASIGRIADLFALRPSIQDGRDPLPGGPLPVELRSVTFGYGPDESVLRSISLTLVPGQLLGLLGRTGSGKTTIARLTLRLFDVNTGSIRVGGRDVRDVPLGDLRRRVALVTQDVQLFHATVRDNLTFFDPAVPDAALRRALDMLGLLPWLARQPGGLDAVVDPRALSAGEAQLLAFARAFFKDPGLVVLDEASSRLDPVTERLIDGAMAALLQGRTGIIIAHRLSTVMRADQIAILEAGEVVERGPRATLMRDETSRFSKLLRVGMEEVLA